MSGYPHLSDLVSGDDKKVAEVFRALANEIEAGSGTRVVGVNVSREGPLRPSGTMFCNIRLVVGGGLPENRLAEGRKAE